MRRSATQPCGASPDGLNPVLWRAYWARGVRDPNDLALGLDRLTPVGTLEGIPAATDILIAHRERRILVVGDFDADGAAARDPRADSTGLPGETFLPGICPLF